MQFEEINNAFTNRTRPERVIPMHVDGYEEYYLEALAFSGKNWKSIELTLLQKFPNSFSEFSCEAFAYYLPAVIYLSRNNKCARMPVITDIIHRLSQMAVDPNEDRSWYNRFDFSKLELRVILKWLVWIFEQEDNFNFLVYLDDAISNVEILLEFDNLGNA